MTQAIDPICGMTVEIAPASLRTEYQGETFYFCAPGCKKIFEKDPASSIQRNQQASVNQEQPSSSCSCCQAQQQA